MGIKDVGKAVLYCWALSLLVCILPDTGLLVDANAAAVGPAPLLQPIVKLDHRNFTSALQNSVWYVDYKQRFYARPRLTLGYLLGL